MAVKEIAVDKYTSSLPSTTFIGPSPKGRRGLRLKRVVPTEDPEVFDFSPSGTRQNTVVTLRPWKPGGLTNIFGFIGVEDNPEGTSVRYRISTDGGQSYRYWDTIGSSWTLSSDSDPEHWNLEGEIDGGIQTLDFSSSGIQVTIQLLLITNSEVPGNLTPTWFGIRIFYSVYGSYEEDQQRSVHNYFKNIIPFEHNFKTKIISDEVTRFEASTELTKYRLKSSTKVYNLSNDPARRNNILQNFSVVPRQELDLEGRKQFDYFWEFNADQEPGSVIEFQCALDIDVKIAYNDDDLQISVRPVILLEFTDGKVQGNIMEHERPPIVEFNRVTGRGRYTFIQRISTTIVATLFASDQRSLDSLVEGTRKALDGRQIPISSLLTDEEMDIMRSERINERSNYSEHSASRMFTLTGDAWQDGDDVSIANEVEFNISLSIGDENER